MGDKVEVESMCCGRQVQAQANSPVSSRCLNSAALGYVMVLKLKSRTWDGVLRAPYAHTNSVSLPFVLAQHHAGINQTQF